MEMRILMKFLKLKRRAIITIIPANSSYKGPQFNFHNHSRNLFLNQFQTINSTQINAALFRQSFPQSIQQSFRQFDFNTLWTN